MSKSKVNWAASSGPLIPNSTQSALTNASRKVVIRKTICDKLHLPLETMQAEWGDRVDVKKQLFYTDANGKMFPKNPLNVTAWKGIIHDYCLWHGITSLSQIVNMWCDIVNSCLTCPNFDTETDPNFRAWMYGCMTKCILEYRKTHPLIRSSTSKPVGK